MKKLLTLTLISFTAFAACSKSQKVNEPEKTTPKKAATPVKDGFQGIYVVREFKGDNSVMPVNLTGLTFERKGDSYVIHLSNVDAEAKTSEKMEILPFTWEDETFKIDFRSKQGMVLKSCPKGLRGTLDGKDILLEKIK
ncbi:MAG: hypothetical protein ACQES9_03075 [Myxococcota bacterium]